jgi:hypothetical protein
MHAGGGHAPLGDARAAATQVVSFFLFFSQKKSPLFIASYLLVRVSLPSSHALAVTPGEFCQLSFPFLFFERGRSCCLYYCVFSAGYCVLLLLLPLRDSRRPGLLLHAPLLLPAYCCGFTAARLHPACSQLRVTRVTRVDCMWDGSGQMTMQVPDAVVPIILGKGG